MCRYEVWTLRRVVNKPHILTVHIVLYETYMNYPPVNYPPGTVLEYVLTAIHIHLHIHMQRHIRLHMDIYMYKRHTCVYTYSYFYTSIHAPVYSCVCVYAYYAHVYVYRLVFMLHACSSCIKPCQAWLVTIWSHRPHSKNAIGYEPHSIFLRTWTLITLSTQKP